jgi:hypothetical protein
MASTSVMLSALLEERYVSKHATISCNTELKLLLCTATAAYIPMAEFMDVFEKAGEIIKREHITRCVYDERNLVAFHQPSMEWFYLVWMERMYKQGLSAYRRLPPDDKYFEQQMNRARKKILQENPWFNFEKYDILYCKTLEEAING